MNEAEIKRLVKQTVSQVFRECGLEDSLQEKPLTGADREHGYVFGCEGLMSVEEARRFLGDISYDTLQRRADARLIRKGKHPDGRRADVCRRSVKEYVSTMEV